MIETLVTNLTLLNLLILGLGAYSITRVIVTDTLFEKYRDKLFQHFPYEGHVSDRPQKRVNSRRTNTQVYVAQGDTFLGKLFSCPWCMGFWVSLGITVGFAFSVPYTIAALLPFALRAFVGMCASRVG